jgi:hypothetical protein
MQTSYAHDQTKRAYKDFVRQFDALMDADVRWTPYSDEAIAARAPQGPSTLCFRDQQFWMTRSPLMFDMYMEEYTFHRVLRQFGRDQEWHVPVVHTVPSAHHIRVLVNF